MQQPTTDHADFDEINPALKRYALFLTKDATRAEDLLQDTYISMLARKTEHTAIEKPGRYMMSIMHNLFIDGLRRTRPEARPVSLDDVEPVATDASQHLKLACRETMDAMARLPNDYREVLTRLACQGQSYGEISAALDIPMGTVMSRIARARAALCAKMGVKSAVALMDER